MWAGLVGALCAPAGVARANGAFPDSQSILTPADRPGEILLVTNFGIVISEDGGQSWGWSCETDLNAFGILYQLGPAPRHRLFVLANDALAYSDDGTCGWQQAGGMATGRRIVDAFPDPTNADRVLAVAVTTAGQPHSVLESLDGGATFGSVIYAGAAGDSINGVEIARADPRIVYVAVAKGLSAPVLARSADAGGHWTPNDLSSQLGTGVLRIISVDPQHPDQVVLRMSGPDHETLAITADGGATVTTPLVISGVLNGFARLPSDTMLVAAAVNPMAVPTLYRSRDHGHTFAPIPNTPSVRGLSVRGSMLYAATDNFGNGYALGASHDEGDTWDAVMSYGDVAGIIPCLKDTCQATCANEVVMGLWSDAICAADLPAPDGGAGGSPATGGGGNGGDGGGASTGDASAPTGSAGGKAPGGSSPAGCGCRVTSGASGETSGVHTALLVAALVMLGCAIRGRRTPPR